MVRIILGTASFMLMWTVCGPLQAQAIKRVRVPTGATGLGETVATAKKDALDKAVMKIADYLKQSEMNSFVVNVDYVRDHVMNDSGQLGEDIRIDGFDKPFKAWAVRFRPDYASDLVRLDREEARRIRAQERQTLTSRVMLGLSLLLLAGVGYVRLDDYTQRRYTRALRVAGIGVASAAAAGLWWVFIQAPG